MELVTNKYTAFALLEKSKNHQVVMNFAPELRDDFDIMMKAVSIHGYSLQYASERLRNNKDIVNRAILKHTLSFKYAGDEIKKNDKFILNCLCNDDLSTAEIYRDCNLELQKDRNFAMAFVKKNPVALKYFPEEFKADREIAMLALKTNKSAFRYIDETLREELDITKIALEFPQNFNYLANKYKDDENHILLALNNVINFEDFPELAQISDRLKDSTEFFTKVIDKRPIMLPYASERLKTNCEFLVFFLDKMEINFDHSYTNHKELLAPIFNRASYYLKYASDEIRNDKHMMLDALKLDPNNIRYASDEIQNMLGSNQSEYVATLEKIISIEALAYQLNNTLSESPRPKGRGFCKI